MGYIGVYRCIYIYLYACAYRYRDTWGFGFPKGFFGDDRIFGSI